MDLLVLRHWLGCGRNLGLDKNCLTKQKNFCAHNFKSEDEG